ncbi:MAG: uL15m family ribosomal protein [Candidatus Nanoarchaeia archaeon]|jgi:large subunit ribosomal protein L15
MIRKPKKSRKKLGYEMHSGLRRRGAGNRGGKGRAGLGKKGAQRKTLMYAQGEQLGQRGFKNPNKTKVKPINLSELMKQVKNGSVNATKLGYGKVLGRGEAIKGVTVKAKYFTQKAKAKIEKANGKAISDEN